MSSIIEVDDDRIMRNYVPLDHGSEYQAKVFYARSAKLEPWI